MRLMSGAWLKRLQRRIKASEQLSKDELEFMPAALEIVETPPSPVGRTTAWILISLFSIAVIWACVGQVDEVTVAQGKVIPSGYTKTIQAVDTGVIKAIHVENGSKVHAGDVLIELDTTLTEADLDRQLKEQAHYQLEIKRLVAEQTGQPFGPEPEANINPQNLQYQIELYRSRTAEQKAKLAVAQQEVKQAQAALASAQATQQKLAVQYDIAITREEKVKDLLEHNALSYMQYLDTFEKRATAEQSLSAQVSEVDRLQHVLQQNLEALNKIVGEYERDVATKLVENRRQLQAIEEELRRAKEKNRRSTITSPIDGVVNQLSIHTIGGVVTPAQALLLIVPEGAQMEIEAWLANKDIGFVYAGQNAEIKVETFNFQKYGMLDATLVEVSSDAVEDKEKGLVYRALLRTDLNYFALANDRTVYLSPGMAVTVEIKTRQKRIIEYFMDPFIKYRKEGLRER